LPRLSASRFGLLLVVLALAAATFGAASASAAQLVTNGDFETGTLEGWHTSYENQADSKWSVYSRTEQVSEPFRLFFPPPSGEHAAFQSSVRGDSDSAILYQEVTLPTALTGQLSMYLAYKSAAPMEAPTPNTLELSTEGNNQQVRVDVLKAGAPLRTLEPGDILQTLFATAESSSKELPPTLLTADLSAFAGQTVVLRIASVSEIEQLQTVVDGVSIETPSPMIAPAPVTPPLQFVSPSNLFRKGKLTLDKKNGTGFLSVNVPDAGTITANDIHSKVAFASFAQTGKKPKAKPVFVRSATVNSAGAGTIKVPIRPTAAAKKILARKGKLSFRVKLTFLPNGGTAAAQAYAGRLAMKLKPARR
jgi:hypothetical protein